MASTRTPAGSGLVACIGKAPVLAGKGGRGSDDDDACGQRDPIFLLILTVNCTQCRFNFYFFLDQNPALALLILKEERLMLGVLDLQDQAQEFNSTPLTQGVKSPGCILVLCLLHVAKQ